MQEFKHRTDLFNEEIICFKYGLTQAEFRRLRREEGFPEPEYFCKVTSPGKFRSPRKVVYWRKSVVKSFMASWEEQKRCAKD